jgi:hypothetical protein
LIELAYVVVCLVVFLVLVWRRLEVLGGIRLEETECWRVGPTRDGATYFRALCDLVPSDAVAYLEGTVDQELRDFLTARQIDSPVQVARGTIWPVPDRHHIRATREHLDALAEHLEQRPVALPATHTHVYRVSRLVLEWYDAFADDPIYVSGEVDEAAVSRFAEALRSGYEWAPHAA